MEWISAHSGSVFVPFGNLRLKHSQNIAIFLALPITSCAINHSINAKKYATITLCKRTPVLTSTGKVGCVIPKVISSEFRMRQYRDDDHREDASNFRLWSFQKRTNVAILFYTLFLRTTFNFLQSRLAQQSSRIFYTFCTICSCRYLFCFSSKK